MSLDTKRQAILDIFCHVFENLIGHLKDFDEAAQPIIDCDCYTVIKECFDPAAKEFGKNPPSTDEKNLLLEDILDKIWGLFTYKYSSNHDLLASFQNYKKVVLESSISSPARIDKFQKIGEKLSCECYSLFCNSEYSGLRRDTKLILTPNNKTIISCIPQKSGGESEIRLKFGVVDYDFRIHINLPYYFFHEYLSHIHSANSFYESNFNHTSSFEDGWLIYIAHQKYKSYLQLNPDIAEHFPYKKHYLDTYIYDITYSENADIYTRAGYELAKDFVQIVGEELFFKISFLLAMTDHDALTSYNPLHSKFLFIIKKWLNRYFKMKEDDKKEEVELLSLATEDKEPLKSLLDVMG